MSWFYICLFCPVLLCIVLFSYILYCLIYCLVVLYPVFISLTIDIVSSCPSFAFAPPLIPLLPATPHSHAQPSLIPPFDTLPALRPINLQRYNFFSTYANNSAFCLRKLPQNTLLHRHCLFRDHFETISGCYWVIIG